MKKLLAMMTLAGLVGSAQAVGISSEKEWYEALNRGGEGGSYELAGDVSFVERSGFSFSGTLDGKGHRIVLPEDRSPGTFLSRAEGAVFRNIAFVYSSGALTDQPYQLNGAVAVAKNCRFENCKAVNVQLVGTGEGCTFVRCVAQGDAFAVQMKGCTLEQCQVLDLKGQFMGAFAGLVYTIEDCTFRECAATFDLDLSKTVNGAGGFAGHAKNCTLENCVAAGRILVTETNREAGGFIGGMDGGSMSDCQACVEINGVKYAGGLIGHVSKASVVRCRANGKVTGHYYVGGLVGYAVETKFERCGAYGDVNGLYSKEETVSGRFVGGFAGFFARTDALMCCAAGNVNAPESSHVGGFLSDLEVGTVSQCFATGNVVGREYVAGFIGYTDAKTSGDTVVANSYARGSATSMDPRGQDFVSAFIGSNGATLLGRGVQVSHCYAVGKVTPNGSGMGCICGGLGPAMSIGGVVSGEIVDAESSYWDTTTTKQKISGIQGVGKATAAMKKKSTYVGWDFSSVWEISEGMDYPVLRQRPGDCKCEIKRLDPLRPEEPCQPDDCKDVYLRVSQNSLHFTCEGGKGDLTVESNQPWVVRKLSGDADCMLSTLSGNGDATLTVSVSANRTDTARSWSWQISSDCATVTLEVRQEVCEQPGPDCSCSIEVDAPKVVFDSCESDSTRVGVTSSGPWSSKVTGGAGLLVTSAGSKGKSTAVFTVSENTSNKPREWDVTFTTRTDCGDTCSTTVHVTQGTCQLACRIRVRPASHTVNANRHWGFVMVTANDFWTLDAKSVPRWVIPLLSAGTAGMWYVPYIVRAQPNCGDGTAVDPRRASLRFVNAQGCSDTFVLDQLGRDCCTFLGVFREGEEQYAFTTNCVTFSLPLEIRSSSAWTVVSESAWIRIAAEDHRTGLLTLGVSASPNGERMGTVRLTNVEGDERIFTVLQTPETLALEPSRIFLPASAGETNIAISCSMNWTVSIPEDVRSWVSVAPDSGRGNGKIVLSVKPNANGDLRLAELTVAAGRIEKELLVVQDTAATHLAITGPDSMRSDEVAENLCFVISPGCKAEQVSPMWSVSGPDGIRIGSDGTVSLDGTLLTRAVATVTARCAADGRTLVGSREIEILPKPGPGVWTSDVAAALAGAKGEGRLIVALASDYNSCSHCRAFEPVARNPEFLKWAHDNGVYLIAATRSGPCGESVTDEYLWTLAASVGHGGSVSLPALAFAYPASPYVGVGLDIARVGNLIGDVEYNGNVTTLIEGVASYLGRGGHVPGSDLYPEGTDKSFAGEAAATYDGYLLDAGGAAVGTINVKVAKGKVDKKTGAFSAKVTATVQLADGSKKISFKNGIADEYGNVTGLTAKGYELEVSLGVNGMGGSFRREGDVASCLIDGARNIFSAKDAESKAIAKAVEDAWVGAVNVVGDDLALAVSIAKKGKVKVSGTVNGAKVSATSQLLVGEESCCIPVIITKKANLAFNLWLLGDGTVEIAGLEDVVAGKAGTLKPGAAFRMDAAVLSAKLPGLYSDYLPDGLPVVQSKTKWVVASDAKGKAAKAGKVAIDKKTGEIDEAKLGANPAALKLTYTAKSGSFKGSFKAYALEKGKIKAYTVNVTGVMIGDTAFGTATLKKPAVSWPVAVE